MWDGNDSDIDSIPDLESVTGSSSSEDEDEDDFILANPDFDDLRSFVKGTRRSKVGKRDVVNSLDVAMLVNDGEEVAGQQVELYDSGASRHMSPY
jgi:hypothetical protein